VRTIPRQRGRPSGGEAPDNGTILRAFSTAALKAGIAGAMGLAILLLISLVQVPLVTCLTVPGFPLIFLSVGVLAGILAGDTIQTKGQAFQVGAVAGFASGVGGGIVAMVLAAFKQMFFEDLGRGVLQQFSEAQQRGLAQSGITPDLIQQTGAVLFALLLCGVGGVVAGAAIVALGGRIYFRLR
jgi:hypothetical protein